MPFRDPIVAGVTLVRDAIQSRNYVTGVSGWTINSDGTAEFSNVIVRADLQSANYVAGVAGYKLDYLTGTLEANAAELHGTLEVGTAGGQRIELTVSSSIPRIELYSHDAGPPAETLPAFIANLVVTPGQPVLEFDSSDTGSGITTLQLVTPNGASAYGEVFISGTNSTGAGIPATVVQLDNAVLLWLTNTTDLSLSSINHALMIGPPSGLNLGMDNNEIMARSNGATSTLFLNNDGGLVQVGGGGLTTSGTLTAGAANTANVEINFNQIWALNNGAAASLFLNFSSAGTVQIGNGTAAGADLLCVAMRPTSATAAGPGGTIVGTTYVSSVGLSGSFPVPASGALLVSWQARLTTVGALSTGAAAQRGLAAMQCQLTNSGGAITHAASDLECVEVPIPVGVTGNAGIYTLGQTVLVTGLTPNSVAFISLAARLTGTAGTPGPSITLSNSRIVATPMP
jgi:hypothetical protein